MFKLKTIMILLMVLCMSHIGIGQEKYAVIIAKTQVQSNNHSQAWIETFLKWEELQSKGYAPQNIYVFFDNGYDYQSPSLAHRYKPNVGIVLTYDAATLDNINKVFNEFKEGSQSVNKLSKFDSLFVWTYEKFSDHKTNIQLYEGQLSKEDLSHLIQPLNANIILDINIKDQ
ncbi:MULTISPECIES: hypothetical protein [unclassified Lentimicrobium]|uniref:hypothetical protein n=1 Tax=unclassified Lentimicrobium TaxID=2677434 RepID=UPI001557C9DC|nr:MULTISPECIES: hypothetical protein [unclassified Lentimicrobium]NPD44517.1 hypothetical protein [Lentimicrobium sp. S6]NPD86967.1 hypothetical protein [Lentimicrobium sp. L6]